MFLPFFSRRRGKSFVRLARRDGISNFLLRRVNITVISRRYSMNTFIVPVVRTVCGKHYTDFERGDECRTYHILFRRYFRINFGDGTLGALFLKLYRSCATLLVMPIFLGPARASAAVLFFVSKQFALHNYVCVSLFRWI